MAHDSAQTPSGHGNRSGVSIVMKHGKRSPRSIQSRRQSRAGERTLQHIQVADNVVEGIEALLWMRAEAARGGADPSVRPPEKSEIYDEAVQQFLRAYEHRPCEAYRTRGPRQGWRSFWVDSRLIERCRKVAHRDGVSVARLVSYALSSYVATAVHPSWHRFRADVSRRAAELLAKRVSSARGAAQTRPSRQ